MASLFEMPALQDGTRFGHHTEASTSRFLPVKQKWHCHPHINASDVLHCDYRRTRCILAPAFFTMSIPLDACWRTSYASSSVFLASIRSKTSSWSTLGSPPCGLVFPPAECFSLLVSSEPNPYLQSLADPNQSSIPAARSPSPAWIICREAPGATSRHTLASHLNHLFHRQLLLMKVSLCMSQWRTTRPLPEVLSGFFFWDCKWVWSTRYAANLRKTVIGRKKNVWIFQQRNPRQIWLLLFFFSSSSGLLPLGVLTANHQSPYNLVCICNNNRASASPSRTPTNFTPSCTTFVNHLCNLSISPLREHGHMLDLLVVLPVMLLSHISVLLQSHFTDLNICLTVVRLCYGSLHCLCCILSGAMAHRVFLT